MPSDAFRCVVCGSDRLDEFTEFASLPRVSSDCRPFPAGGRLAMCEDCGGLQTLPDARWLSETAEIYATFSIYHQSGGVEQAVFDAGGASELRSDRLLRFLTSELAVPPNRVLDFGCGTGATLRAVNRQWPDAELWGSELSDASIGVLRQIPNFRALHTCPPSEIEDSFDLIVMVHSLEHLVAPIDVLRQLGGLLRPNGRLFVQVPNADENPFDLVVADHVSHFSPDTLARVTTAAGLPDGMIRTSVVAKEITYLSDARPSHAPKTAIRAPDMAKAEADLDWLQRQLDAARTVAESGRRLGVFGSSIAATWLFGGLGAGIDFFVDEDPARVGGKLGGRPILSVAEVPADATVLVPLIPRIAEAVIARLERRGITCQAA